jgi:hypothetical protein
MVGRGDFQVLEPNFWAGRETVRWERILFFFGLAAVLAVLNSCGSASTAATPTISVFCTPSDVTVLGTSQCTATVANLSSTLVNWSVAGASGAPAGLNFGTITAGGLYTAPAVIPGSSQQYNSVVITAAAQVQASLTATDSVTLEPATAITAVICDDASGNAATTVSSGNTLTCTATTTTGAIVPVYWSVANATSASNTTNLGSISSQGVYTAPLVPPPGQKVTITATSQSLSTETFPITATVTFGGNVLNGQYVFSLSGRLTNTSNAFFARVGSFSAGGGTLTGIEDTNQGGTPNVVSTQRTFTGSYSIGPDGRGTMQFCEGTSAACPQGSGAVTSYFRIAVISPTQLDIIQFSSPAANSAVITAGGEIVSQDSSVFSGNQILSGVYSFNFYGVSTGATEESAVGDFSANGFGTIAAGSSTAPGETDIDANGPTTLASTTYLISSNGRGTMTLGGLSYSFYMVSAGRAKFIEIDAPTPPATAPASILTGDAYEQQASASCPWGVTNALSGATVLQTYGSNSGVVIGDVGSFTASSSGAISSASIDENSGGTVSSTLGTLTGTYTVDPCGRGTLTVGTHSYVFYIISPSDAVLQETTSGVIAHGFLVPSQGGPFVDTTLTGSYAFRFGGTDAAATAGLREDFIGQITSAGTGTGLAGTLDLNDYGATQPSLAIANGMYMPAPSGSLRATATIPVATTPATTRNLVLYMVSPTLFYALDVDPSPAGTAIGVIEDQF